MSIFSIFFFQDPKKCIENNNETLCYDETVGKVFINLMKASLEEQYSNILFKIIEQDEDVLDFYPYFNFYELDNNEISVFVNIFNKYITQDNIDEQIMRIWLEEILPKLKEKLTDRI